MRPIDKNMAHVINKRSAEIRQSIPTLELKTTSPVGNGYKIASRIVREEGGKKVVSVLSCSEKNLQVFSVREFVITVFRMYEWTKKHYGRSFPRDINVSDYEVSRAIIDNVVDNLNKKEVEKIKSVALEAFKAAQSVVNSGQVKKHQDNKVKQRTLTILNDWIYEAIKSGVTEKQIRNIIKLAIIKHTMAQ